jgi:hypothetical protein
MKIPPKEMCGYMIETDLKCKKFRMLLKEGNDDEIIFRRDVNTFKTIVHKHGYTYINMHPYTCISEVSWMLRQHGIDERNKQQCTLRTFSLLAWAERETIALCRTLNRRGRERKGAERSEGGFRYCCGHCEFVEK